MDIFHNILQIHPGLLNFLMMGEGLFGVPLSFVLGFFLKLILLFAASAVISKLLHLNKAYNHQDDHSNK